MAKKKNKRVAMSEETKDKIKASHKRRKEAIKAKEVSKFDGSKDMRSQVWDWLDIK